MIDFLNTKFDYTGYERLGMTKLLRSLAASDSRIALYTLGENLHMLHDFTDDPQKLTDAAAKLDQPTANSRRVSPAPFGIIGDLLDLGREEVHGQNDRESPEADRPASLRRARAVRAWFGLWMTRVACLPAVMALLQQANIVLYPVLVRCVRCE